MIDIQVNGDAVKVNGAGVTTADVAASTGVIDVIEQVLLPPEGRGASPDRRRSSRFNHRQGRRPPTTRISAANRHASANRHHHIAVVVARGRYGAEADVVKSARPSGAV